MTAYRFVGPGLGVPGLPHEIESKSSLSESQKEILDAALEAGTYEKVKSRSSSSSSADDGDGEDES